MKSYDIDAEVINQKLSFDVNAYLSTEKRISGSLNDEIWQAALELTGDDSVGIEFVKHFHIASLDGLGFSLTASNSLLDAFYRLSRYFAVISSVGKVVIEQQSNAFNISLELPVAKRIANDAGVDSALALFLHLGRLLAGEELRPTCVYMQREKPIQHQKFTSFFGTKLYYDSARNTLSFDRAQIAKKLPFSNEDIALLNDRHLDDYLALIDESYFASKVSALIIDYLPFGTPCKIRIAEKLEISTKTLQRRLELENTCFSTLLMDIRYNLSSKYLQNKSKSISEIANLLGFSEPTNFIRWFKLKHGVTPLQFRRHYLNTESSLDNEKK